MKKFKLLLCTSVSIIVLTLAAVVSVSFDATIRDEEETTCVTTQEEEITPKGVEPVIDDKS